MNIVKPIEGYERGVSAVYGALTRNENVATQPWRGLCEVGYRICPDELELLLFRQIEGVAAVAARRVRDNVDAFGGWVMEDTLSNGVSTVIIVLDCVDGMVFLVGHPNLAGVAHGGGWPEV